jgi:hypothetical protein
LESQPYALMHSDTDKDGVCNRGLGALEKQENDALWRGNAEVDGENQRDTLR